LSPQASFNEEYDMSEYTPEQGAAVISSQIGEQAASVAPPASASLTTPDPAGKAAEVDVAALLARLNAMEEQIKAASEAAAAAQAAAEPKQPTLAEVVVNVADSGARHALLIIGEELDAIRAHVGL